MTARHRRRYHRSVDVLRTLATRWIAAGLGLLLFGLVSAAPGVADTTTTLLGDQPVIRILVRGAGNDVLVHTWDRPFLQVDSPDVTPTVTREGATWGTPTRPLVARLPPFAYVERQDGQVIGTGLLPPEDFPFSGFRVGPHDVVTVAAPAGSHLIVTVPAGTGILEVRSGGGQTTIDGYRGANLFVLQGNGRVRLSDSDTTAFLQQQNGQLSLIDDDFARVRVRVNAAGVAFERCRTTQIEASTISGSIVYDGGTFEPGLARFESETGSIALGVNAGAELVAHSQSGRVFTQFDAPTALAQQGESDARATVGGGGALVNAISQRGNVYLYDGAFADHRGLGPEWRPVHEFFNRRAGPRPQRFERLRRQAQPLRAGIFSAPRRRV
jgi:hypothetical protein